MIEVLLNFTTDMADCKLTSFFLNVPLPICDIVHAQRKLTSGTTIFRSDYFPIFILQSKYQKQNQDFTEST